MAWTPMYLMKEDIAYLNDWLNQENEIAFLVSNGQNKWIAKEKHDIISDLGAQKTDYGPSTIIPNFVEFNLWHVPSGSLPLLESKLTEIKNLNYNGKITDPWSGWTEKRPGANPRIPYFGAGHPGVIHLEIRISENEEIPMSCFGWIGNYYKIIGNGADPSTEKFWNKLKRMIKKTGILIPRANDTDWKKEIYALPNAYSEIKNGKKCSMNP